MNSTFQTEMRTGGGYDLILQVNHGKGYTFWVNVKCEPVRNDQDESAALYGTIQDITENMAHEEARRDSEHEAREAARQGKHMTGLFDDLLNVSRVTRVQP